MVVGVLVGSALFARATYRYIRATPFQRTRMRLAWRIGRHWRRDAVNLGLARVDENTRGAKDMHGKTKPTVTVVPKLRVVPEPYGVRAHLITIPKVGIEEVQKAAGWIADAWGCETVEAKRLKSGLVEIRGLFGNPLDEHFDYDFEASGWVLPIGRSPWGRMIGIPLKDLSGIKVAGMPGFGKTMLQLAWVGLMSRSPLVQFAFFDGKTSDPRYGDWGQVGERAMFIVGDNPETANQRLTELVRLLKDRPAALVEERGTHKFWKHGPTEANPLVIVFMDECHNYIDSDGLKGRDKELIDSNKRLMRTVAKEGRGLGVLPIVATQKQTTDSIPSGVRDNLGVGISFAVFTMDGAVAALGSGIRDDEANDPTALNDPERFVGVAVVTGVPGLGGRYERVRVGDVDEDLMLHLVGSSVGLRRDIIPAAAPTVVDASAGASAEPETTKGIPLQKPKTNTRRRKTA
jgi:S-DNA-T family DNA segregation ATPase FtsK/SpoIIIE